MFPARCKDYPDRAQNIMRCSLLGRRLTWRAPSRPSTAFPIYHPPTILPFDTLLFQIHKKRSKIHHKIISILISTSTEGKVSGNIIQPATR
jgi:hypothetical protein